MSEYSHPPIEEAGTQARLLIKNFRSTDPERTSSARARLRLHPHFRDFESSIADGAKDVRLSHAQYVVAAEWGFAGWEQLAAAFKETVDEHLLERIRGLRGFYYRLSGHTDEDAVTVLSDLSAWTGLDLVCVWDYRDAWGCGGNSEHAVRVYASDDETFDLHGIPPLIWEYLWAGGDGHEDGVRIDPHALRSLTVADAPVDGLMVAAATGPVPVDSGDSYNMVWTDKLA